jgi:hypothetical protein
MELVQWYDTTVADRDQDATARFLVVPARSVPSPELLANRTALMQRLGLQSIQDLVSPSFLPHAFLAVLTAETADDAKQRLEALLSSPQAFADTPPDLRSFAEQLAFAPLVPFEASTPDLTAIASIVAKAAGAGYAVGAVVGVVASGPTPLILVTVPAGMIICGAAAGVAKALEEGLYERLIGWIRGRSDRTPSPEQLKEVIRDKISSTKKGKRSRMNYLGLLKSKVGEELTRRGFAVPGDDVLTEAVARVIVTYPEPVLPPNWTQELLNDMYKKRGRRPPNILGNVVQR